MTVTSPDLDRVAIIFQQMHDLPAICLVILVVVRGVDKSGFRTWGVKCKELLWNLVVFNVV